MNIALWVVQALLGGMFIIAGATKAFRYTSAREMLPWVRDVPKGLVTFIGVAEVLGGIGLILPLALGMTPWLTPLAALALVVVMVLGAVFHFTRKEWSGIAFNLVLLALAAFVVWGRWDVFTSL